MNHAVSVPNHAGAAKYLLHEEFHSISEQQVESSEGRIWDDVVRSRTCSRQSTYRDPTIFFGRIVARFNGEKARHKARFITGNAGHDGNADATCRASKWLRDREGH